MIWSRSQTEKLGFKPALIDIRKCIVGSIRQVEDQAKIKNISITFEFSDDLQAFCDKNMIDTVLRNLLTNAIKFTPREGNISIGIKTGNEDIEISVNDTGIGIKNENIDRLFRLDGNLTTKGTENEKGTGLGLILCKEFIEKNGGKIWAESEPGKGSRFVFTVPRQKTSDPF
jgi:two-component system sensor histidine kinase/response regulator